MTKKSKVTVQKLKKKKTSVKEKANMRQVRRIVVSLRAKMTGKKRVRKARIMIRLKVKKSVTQSSMNSLIKAMAKMKSLVTLSRIKVLSP